MVRGIIFDLDGTVYRGTQEVPGAAPFIRRLLDDGIRPLYVTNRANRPPDEVCAQLRGLGVPCAPADVLTSAEATAMYLSQQGVRSVYRIGEEGIRQALSQAGIAETERAPEAVVVSLDRSFNYDKMKTASRLIAQGALFVATNPDRWMNVEDGRVPGTGAIVAALTAASGVEPTVIGKPGRLIIDLAVDRLGFPHDDVIAVGDNLETDIMAAKHAGVRSVLILTGVSTREDLAGAEAEPDWVVDDYAGLAALVWRLRRTASETSATGGNPSGCLSTP